MNLKTLIFTNNDCYKAGQTIPVKGVMIHSTGANNPDLKRYVGPDDGSYGVNPYNNHWNMGGVQACVHGFIGKLADGSIASCQTLPWDMRGWHGGSGIKGSVNNTHIGFEICEDALTDPLYFAKVYQEAMELTAYLCTLFHLDPLADGVVIGHYEGYQRGLATNHADPGHWFPRYGKSMDLFRADVAAWMRAAGNMEPVQETNDQIVWAFLKNCGLSDCAAAGLMGNLSAESGLKPDNLQNSYENTLHMTDASYTAAVDNGNYTNFVRDSAGYGLAQWTYWSRKQALLDFTKAAGVSVGDLRAQLAFLWRELQDFKGLVSAIQSAKTVMEASNLILSQYESPADQSPAVQQKRADLGQAYYNQFAGHSVTQSDPSGSAVVTEPIAPAPPAASSRSVYQATIQAKCNFSDPEGVWAVMDAHPFAEEMYKKWAESYR